MKTLAIPNLIHKLSSDFFVHISPIGTKTYLAPYNQKVDAFNFEQPTMVKYPMVSALPMKVLIDSKQFELIDVLKMKVKELPSILTYLSHGMDYFEFKKQYVGNVNDTIGVYVYKLIKP